MPCLCQIFIESSSMYEELRFIALKIIANGEIRKDRTGGINNTYLLRIIPVVNNTSF